MFLKRIQESIPIVALMFWPCYKLHYAAPSRHVGEASRLDTSMTFQLSKNK